jgi:cardiolipin synthase (CMP-forming)
VLTLANRLTILRILLTPAIAIFLLYRYTAIALVLFVAAGITDGLDGFVARRRGQRTAVGMVLDPLADKLLLASAIIVLTILRELPRWFTIIIVSRDLILIGGSVILYMFLEKISTPPSWLGKATTGLQIATVLLAMLDNFAPALRVALLPMAVLTAAVTIGSGLHYVWRGMRLLNDQ